jgi:hypothetical protein
MQVAHIGRGCDDTVRRLAAEGTVDFAGPLPLELLPRVSHSAADQVPDRISEL